MAAPLRLPNAMLLLLPAVTASPETAGIANVVWTTSMSDAQRTASQDLRDLTTCENSNGDCYNNPCGSSGGVGGAGGVRITTRKSAPAR